MGEPLKLTKVKFGQASLSLSYKVQVAMWVGSRFIDRTSNAQVKKIKFFDIAAARVVIAL